MSYEFIFLKAKKLKIFIWVIFSIKYIGNITLHYIKEKAIYKKRKYIGYFEYSFKQIDLLVDILTIRFQILAGLKK